MYHLLDWAVPRGIPAGFVHVPGEADMPVETCTRAVERILRYLVREGGFAANGISRPMVGK